MMPPQKLHDIRCKRHETTADGTGVAAVAAIADPAQPGCTVLDPGGAVNPEYAVLFSKDGWIAELNLRGAQRRSTFFCIDAWGDHAFICDAGGLGAGLLRYDIRGRTSRDAEAPDTHTKSENDLGMEIVSRLPFGQYKTAFDSVQAAIHRGESWLANLTASTGVNLSDSLSGIYDRVSAPYRLWVSGSLLENAGPALETGPEGFVVFSPEAFVRIEHDTIATFPMKGTRFVPSAAYGHDENTGKNAVYGPDNGQQEAIRAAIKALLADPKEEAEHTTVVDLLRNDLGRVATQIRVPKFRYTESIPVEGGILLQTSSHIQGTLDPGWQNSLGSILADLLPAGSVTGAPKHRTVEIVREVEESLLGHERGWYAGVFGLFYGEGLDSAVSIRYMEDRKISKNEHFPVFKSGGGVTYASEAVSEYDELIQKVRIPITKRPQPRN